MADSFGCNVEAVEATARKLNDVLDELGNFTKRYDTYADALASNNIHSALTGFSDNSSDQRKKITGSIEALAKMLQGLADGVHDVDHALAGSLPEVTQPEPVPGPGTPAGSAPNGSSAAEHGRSSGQPV